MIKNLIVGLAVFLCASLSVADDTIRLLGTPTVSPDGKTLVFASRNDLWMASTLGGGARRLTSHPARDRAPVFAHDGKTLAFTSDRTGSDQVFLMDVQGGAPRRLTTHTDGSRAVAWMPGDKGLLIAATQDHFWRRAERLFFKKLKLEAKPQLMFDDYGRDASVSPDGRHIVFTREGTAWWRKQYRGSQASQVWLYDIAARGFTKVSKGVDEERWPLWGADGETLYYVSQVDGTNNLYRRTVADGATEQLTDYKDDGVLFPAIAGDGSVIVYRHLFDLYRLDPRTGGKPVRIDLQREGDRIHDPIQRTTLTRAAAASFSDDGREIVFTAGGDVWVMDTELREPVRLTDTPEEERDPVFAPDFQSILYVSDAGGQTDIWKVERKDSKRHWWQNTEFVRTALTRDDAVERRPRFTPDGRVAFLRVRGDLHSMKPDGSDGKVILHSWNDPSFAFSPCGQWVAYAVDDNDFNRDIWVCAADGTGEAVNVSRHPDTEDNPVWSPDGKLLAFRGQRSHDENDLYYVWLQKEGDETTKRDRALEKAEKKMSGRKAPPVQEGKKPGAPPRGATAIEKFFGSMFPKPKAAAKTSAPKATVIDFDRISDRIRRVAIPNATETGLMFSPDSKRLAFHATIDGREGLYTISIPDELKPAFLASRPGGAARWLKEGDQIVGLVRGVPASTTGRGKTTSYPFRAVHQMVIGQRNQAAFDVAWRVMRDYWYDDKHNNRDWAAVRAKYREMAAATHTDRELAQVVSMMLGELNGSHLGFWTARRGAYTPPGWRQMTGHLGARFVDVDSGPGLKIRDVIAETPAAAAKTRLHAGERILEVDGTVVEPDHDPALYFTGEPGRFVTLKMLGLDGKEREVTLQPMATPLVRRLLYNHWTAGNRAAVDKASKGKLGYLHVRGMNWPSFERFEAELYKVGHGKDGLIIDVRENGGGFTTDHLLTCLCQPVHAITVPRGGARGYPQGRMVYARWSKPIVVLCNQNSFSNAEIFAHAIKQIGRGRVVGVTTAGGVISTGATKIMGFATLRLPFRGWYLSSTGEDMERAGCVPDASIWPEPEEWTRGQDRQLAHAVNWALQDVATAAARAPVALRRASERGKAAEPSR